MDRVQEVLRRQLVDERRLPPFVYLASCHSNEPAGPERDEPASASAAVQLHLAGLPEVVGYFGPIVDELSTRVEDALYDAIAEGLPTPDAVRRARHAFAQPLDASDHRHRPGGPRSAAAESMGEQIASLRLGTARALRRGPEWPLSPPSPPGRRRVAWVLSRRFEGFGNRKIQRGGLRPMGRAGARNHLGRRTTDGAGFERPVRVGELPPPQRGFR